MSPALVISAPVVVPLIGALLCLLSPRLAVRGLGLGAAVLSALCSIPLVALVARGEVVVTAVGGWPAPLAIGLRADGLAALMIAFAAVVGVLVSWYSQSYFGERRDEVGPRLFWSLWLLVWSGLDALFLSADLFNLYVTLEVISLGSVGLVAITGSRAALRPALRYLLLAMLGSLSYLLGIGLIYADLGVLDLYLVGQQIATTGTQPVALALLIGGLLVKCALVPLHFWLPGAHANAPAPVSAMLSSLVVTAAFYLILRLWFEALLGASLDGLGEVLGALGVVAIFYGGWQALRQDRLKLVIAYSTVSQIGYLFLVFPLCQHNLDARALAWNGTVYFAIAHGLSKASAFLAAGSLQHLLGSDRIASLRGCGRHNPFATFVFAIAGVNLMGLPPSGGFIGKWMLLLAAFEAGRWGLAIAILGGGLLAAAYLFRVIEPLMTSAPGPDASPDTGPGSSRVPNGQRLPALVLAGAAVALAVIAALPLEILSVGAPVPTVSFVPVGVHR